MSEEKSNVNSILSVVIEDIHNGKDKIFNIAESLKSEYDTQVMELNIVEDQIKKLIKEVDRLEKVDKLMRENLAKASANFEVKEEEVRLIYEEALNIRVEYITMQKEEKRLQTRRESLQRSIKNNFHNIKDADNVIEQVNVALSYLKGDVYKNIESAEESSKIAYAIRFVEAQEKERNRIAREIHDGPAQYLASTLMRIDFCKMLLNKDLEEGLVELEDLKSNVRKTLKEVRGIIFDLKPPFLNGITLEAAIEDLKEAFMEETSTNLTIDIENSDYEVDYVIEVAVYRIIQEILNNIKKHAEAKNSEVQLEIGEEYIYLSIKDDGKGFDVTEFFKNARKNTKNYGLKGIYDRIDELGGSMQIKSLVGEGTQYRIKLPTIRGNENSDKVSYNG